MAAHRSKKNHRSAVIWPAARVFASWRSDPDCSDRDFTVIFSPNQHKVYFCLRRVAQGSSLASKKTGLRWGRVWRLFMHLLEHLITTSASSLSSLPYAHSSIAQPLHCRRIMNIWMYSWNCFKKKKKLQMTAITCQVWYRVKPGIWMQCKQKLAWIWFAEINYEALQKASLPWQRGALSTQPLNCCFWRRLSLLLV